MLTPGGTSRLSQADADGLMARLAAGDVDALGELYEAYVALVFGIAKRVVGYDDPAAEDVVQASFLNLWRSAATYKSGNLTALVSRITRNVALDAIRRRREIPDPALDWGHALTVNFDEIAFAALDRATIRSAVVDLPNRERLPIEMGFFEGLTHVEIAERINVPLGTVKTRIRAGLQRLRIALAASVEESPGTITRAHQENALAVNLSVP